MKIYGDIQSGNCYRTKLLISLLNNSHDYQWIPMDILAKDTHKPEFLKINPNGKIPALALENGCVLTESNAILNYLAHGTIFLPENKFIRAKILQWQFFEQYIAVARFINKYLGLPENKKEEYASKQKGGYKALAIMEQQLNTTPFLVNDTPSIAHFSLYAYTHVEEGGFDLSLYQNIQQWLLRTSNLPRYIGID